jgi:trehalose 6-phosphate phosphatase
MPARDQEGNGLPPGLPAPTTTAGRAGLAALIAQPASALVALDFDGTLAPIVDDPAAARADPATTDVLGRLAGLTGTVAIITGRPAAEAAEFAGLTRAPGVIVLGHYGSQRWQDGKLASPPVPPGLAAARAELPQILTRAGAAPGTRLEDKEYALAVHTRQTASPQTELDRLGPALAALAARTGLAVEPGRYVIELRLPGSDKGQALRGLAAERSSTAVLFCGDDLGDRPAFRAVKEMRSDGTPGLVVCSGSAEVPELALEADLVVDGPPGVAELLTGLTSAFARRAADAG